MQSIIADKRIEIKGGTWTPKVAANFEEGSADENFFVEGRLEIKELGGHLKLFCENLTMEKRKVHLEEDEIKEVTKEYREKIDALIESQVEKGEEVLSDEGRVELEGKELPVLIATALEEKEKSVVPPPTLYIYLTKNKPKTKMNDVQRTGTRVHLPAEDNSGKFNRLGSIGTFEASLKDIPDALMYQGAVVVKLPNDHPKTEKPRILGLLKFQSAKHIKIHSMNAIQLTDISDLLTRLLKKAEGSARATKASDAAKGSHYYSTAAKQAWASFRYPLDEEVDFATFCKMLDNVNIFLCEAQAKRIFLAVDVDGSGEMGVSEFENFLMAYDIMGDAGADLAALDVYESLKMYPTDSFGEFGNHEGMDYSAFKEGIECLGVREDLDEEEIVRAFTDNGKRAPVDKVYLTHDQFKKAWTKLADLEKEITSRGLKYDGSALAKNRLRDRLYRVITDQENSYLENLKNINDIVERIKHDRREKKDERKREKQSQKDALMHEAAKFQALRGQEKRLMAKMAEEEKTKKRFEERALRAKLMVQQKDARDREMREIQAQAAEGEKLRADEVRRMGMDRLSLSVQNLRFVPEHLYATLGDQTKLSYLIYFDLSHNILDCLPEKNFMYFMVECQHLKLSQNRLKRLPEDEIQYMAKLRILEIESNKLESFPHHIGNCTNLTRLDISTNKLKKLPESLGLCLNLKYFSAHSNDLDSLPNSLGGCFNLEYIDISRNQVQQLPEDMGCMTSLKHLDCNSNRIGHLPRDIGLCGSLVFMDFSVNILVFLPESFKELKKLEVCNLERNELIIQEDRFTHCENLKDLRIKKNHCKSLCSDIGACKMLLRIDASYNEIETVAPEIGLMTSLQELDLSCNSMKSIPPELASCGMIQSLDVKYNKIEGCLPETIGLIESLKVANVSFNRIDEFPESIIGLRSLEVLQAEHCLMYKLPESFVQLDTLLHLDLQNNKFTRFPIELGDMKNLKRLILRNNSIELLPRTIPRMCNLEVLDISRNLLRALPVEFTDVLESVPEVQLEGNTWQELPEKWGKLWIGRASTDEPWGYSVADAVDFLYGMRTFYDAAELIWKELGAFHYTHRLGFGDFIEELRSRIPHAWHEGLVEHVKTLYFQARSTGVFPRWYSLEGHDNIKEEKRIMKQIDAERREKNVQLAREGDMAKRDRMKKAYDTAPALRADYSAMRMSEHALNEQVINNMSNDAIRHCLSEREKAQIKRVQRREAKMLKKERHEMERLQEILETDRESLDGNTARKRRQRKKKAATLW
jgi:leucine-rich repeat protein SHOC2